MNTWIQGLTISATLGTALVGGIFFAFSNFVMGALGELVPSQGIRAMQSINRVVLNPLFLGLFAGTAALCLVLIILLLVTGYNNPTYYWHYAAGAFYIIGTFLVTGLGNVPLNNALAAAIPETDAAQLLWQGYLERWTFLNHVRTIAATAAALCFMLGLIQNAKAI